MKKYIFLQLTILLYSISTIPSKLASNERFLSIKFCILYGIVILILGIYAILWQQVLKKCSLSIAYACKATTIIWSIVISYYLFNERVTIYNIVGSIIVMAGILLMIRGEKQ